MKIGIFYGSSTGTTAEVAAHIAKALGIDAADVHDVAKTAPSAVGDYDLLVFGSPTYGAGDLQDDWYDFLDGLSALTLSGKKAAVFGCGDENMSDTFCDAVGLIYSKVKATGAEMVGAYNVFPYTFEKSLAVPVPGAEAVGLLIDEVNHPEATDERIAAWAEMLLKA